MIPIIAILEDDPQRITVMQSLLSSRFPQYKIVFVDNASDFISWLKLNYNSVELISLDHDLELCSKIGETNFDPGDGRDVTEFMQNLRPICPVIIHTSNSSGRASMRFMLSDSGWKVSIVFPEPDLTWIKKGWLEEVENILR